MQYILLLGVSCRHLGRLLGLADSTWLPSWLLTPETTDISLTSMQGGTYTAEGGYSALDADSSILFASVLYFSDGCPSLQNLNISWCDNIQDKGAQMYAKTSDDD